MTYTLLRPSLRYDPETGIAEYLNRTGWHRLKASDHDGYLHASMGTAKGRQKKVTLHRIIYAFFHGPIPDGMQIDHMDCDKCNNRLSNLRAVTPTINSRNRKMEAGVSGYPGVWWSESRKLWTATISRNGLGKNHIKNRGKDPARVYAWYYARKGSMHGLDSLRNLPKPDVASKTTRVAKVTA